MVSSEPDVQDVQLSAYRCLLDNARAMLKAAREERWDDLTALEAERQSCFARVVDADLISTRPASVEARMEMINSILQCDEQTKALIKAWQGEMSEVLDSMGNRRKLADAYQSG